MKSSQYVALFVDEAGLLLEQCLSCLEQLEASIADSELHRELFRLVHTLKGMASTLVELPYFEDITQLSHSVEALLEQQNQVLVQEHLYLLADSFQALGDLIRNVANPEQSAPVPLESLYARFQGLTQIEEPIAVHHALPIAASQALSLSPEEQTRAAELQTQGLSLSEVHVELMPACLMKAVRALLVLHNLEQRATVLATLPPMELLREGAFDTGFTVLTASDLEPDALRDLAEAVSEIEEVRVKPYQPEAAPAASPPSPPAPPPVSAAAPDGGELNEFELNLLQEAARLNLKAVWLRFRVTRQVQMQSARISLIFTQLESHGEVIKTLPSVEELEAEKFAQHFELLVITPESPEELRKHLLGEADIHSWLSLDAHLHGEAPPAAMPVLPPPTALRISPAGGEAREGMLLPHSPELPESERLKSIRMQHLVRVDARQLDMLNELTGELLLIRSRMNHATGPVQLRQELGGLNRVMALLQAVSMKLQTVTAAHVFHRYPRMVRDLARSLGKEIVCQLQGEQVEISRAYVDDLSSVLLHMIRNAADHGLETSTERLRMGKPRQGTIVLSAAYNGQAVQIEVRDDGRGIDVEALKQKALKQQLMSREELDGLCYEDSLQLIFSPGLSTSATATDISGRGVGMDVVRNHIKQVGGTLHVESRPGHGTRFVIALPSAFRQVRSLLVRVEQQFYALPFEGISKIRQGLEVPPLAADSGGAVIALQSLATNGDDIAFKPESILLQIRNGDRPVWLIADELIGAQDLAVRQLANGHEDVVRGAAMLGAEDVALYLEPALLLKLADA